MKTFASQRERETYHIWQCMKRRCDDTNSTRYRYYGGRGIIVCDRWLHSFQNFVADMGMRPASLTLDRINNDGNYEPSNCRWATPKEQAANRRSSLCITVNGYTGNLRELCLRFGKPYARTYWRLFRAQWSAQRAFDLQET